MLILFYIALFWALLGILNLIIIYNLENKIRLHDLVIFGVFSPMGFIVMMVYSFDKYGNTILISKKQK